MSASQQQPFEIITGDALTSLESLEDSSIQLVMTSPPYNIGKSYERDNFKSLEEYTEWMGRLLDIVHHKLSPTGSLCLQIGNYVKDGAIIPLDYIFYPLLTKSGFTLRNRIIWTFNFGLHARKRLSGRYEVILWLTKSNDYVFNLDEIRVPQIYPGKRHASSKSKSGPSGNPLGKNPADFWVFDGSRFFDSDLVWRIPNVKSNHPEKTSHPCQFPSELVERCILAFTNPGDLVVDPFSGVGTVPIAAEALNRQGVGIEIKHEYAELSRQRAIELKRGSISIREAGKEARLPLARERVAQVPPEWLSEAAE